MVFRVLSGSLNFPRLSCAMPFWGIRLVEWGDECCEEPSAPLLAVLGCAWEHLQLTLTWPDLLLLLGLAGSQYEVVWLQGVDVLTC